MMKISVKIEDEYEPTETMSYYDYLETEPIRETSDHFVAPVDSTWAPVAMAMISVLERHYGYKFQTLREALGEAGKGFDWEPEEEEF